MCEELGSYESSDPQVRSKHCPDPWVLLHTAGMMSKTGKTVADATFWSASLHFLTLMETNQVIIRPSQASPMSRYSEPNLLCKQVF